MINSTPSCANITVQSHPIPAHRIHRVWQRRWVGATSLLSTSAAALVAVTETATANSPPIYRVIDLGAAASDGVRLSVARLGMNEFCAVAGTRVVPLDGGGVGYRAWVWLPPNLRPTPAPAVTVPDEFGCYPLPNSAGDTNSWAAEVNDHGVAVGTVGTSDLDCDATLWTTGNFVGPVASRIVPASPFWSAFVSVSDSLTPIAVGTKAVECDVDWRPFAFNALTDAEIPVPLPDLPWNAPFSRNSVVNVLDVKRQLKSIDRGAATWVAQAISGSRITNCIGGGIGIHPPKLDTAGYAAPIPLKPEELPSLPSPLVPALVEATWSTGINDFGQICGAIDKLGSGTSNQEHWQPCIWESSGGAVEQPPMILPIPQGTTGGHIVAIDSAITGVRRACGFTGDGPHHSAAPVACAWEKVTAAGGSWCAYHLHEVTLPRNASNEGPVLDIAYDRSATGQIAAFGGGRAYLLTHRCDFDGDLGVGSADVTVLLSNWGVRAGDVDGDGTTGAADLALLFSDWTAGNVAVIPLHCVTLAAVPEDLVALDMAHSAMGTTVTEFAQWRPSCPCEQLAFECTCSCIQALYCSIKQARDGQGGEQ